MCVRASKKYLRFASLAVISAVLVSCAADTGNEQPTESEEPPPPSYTSTWVEPEVMVLSPLTGEFIPENTLQHPSIAAKVDNHIWARPHFGLEHADIVFEELVEGGITRYVAVWHSDLPSKIGPVRSIRPMDPDIIAPLGGVAVYSGGQRRFVDMMQNTRVENVVFDYADHKDILNRDRSRPAPHNVVLNASTLASRLSSIAPPQQHFAFAADVANATAVKEGKEMSRVDVVFTRSRYPHWTYNANAGVFYRHQEGRADMSASGVQLSAVNMVVMRVDIDYRFHPGVPRTVMVGSGKAWVFTGGKYVEGTWSKANQNAAIEFHDATGNQIRLAPGNTWIELMPSDTGSVKVQ